MDDGNVEYKFRLTGLTDERIDGLVTQMKYRIHEGKGECFYLLGVHDGGQLVGLGDSDLSESVDNLRKIASRLGCSVQVVQESKCPTNDKQTYGQYLIRHENNSYIDIKVGVVGNVDSGKSSLVGVLCKNVLDDGRGKSRSLVFNYKHEIQTGRTSSISHQILGFDANGHAVAPTKLGSNSAWGDIVTKSSKIVSFYDLAGHEKYLKTTIYGLSMLNPDYAIVMCGSNMGISQMTKEHLSLCLSLQIPFIIVLSKIDIAPANILKENIDKINQLCKKWAGKMPYHVKNMTDAIDVSQKILTNGIVPIVQISNVSSHNIDLLKSLLNMLPRRNDYSKVAGEKVEMLIDCHYHITGHGTVVSGILRSGTVRQNDSLFLGPCTQSGGYKPTKVKSIHSKFTEVKEAECGKYVCLCLKGVARKEIKRGMILTDLVASSGASERIFWARMSILQSHHTTIRPGYEPFLHVCHVRQAAKIVDIRKISRGDSEKESGGASAQTLRTGDKAFVQLEFKHKAEYLNSSMKVIFRDGNIKAVGAVVDPSRLPPKLAAMLAENPSKEG